MKKTLREVAHYLNTILVPVTQDDVEFEKVYTDVYDEASIRDGVFHFRAFLKHLYEVLEKEADKYDTCKKATHVYENRTTLSQYYPFVHHVGQILMNIGYDALEDESKHCLVCDGRIFNPRLTTSKSVDCIRFLMLCGLRFEGIDVDDKKQDITKITTLNVYYDEVMMYKGLKVMAIAQYDHATLVNQDVFLRCDYRALKNEKPSSEQVLRDTIRNLPTPIQDFVLQLHQTYTQKGLQTIVEIKGFHIYIRYCFKRKDFWGINVSLNNGYHINVKPQKIEEYKALVETFDPSLQAIIKKGYGCGRKGVLQKCDGGCRGMIIPLDNTIETIQNDIKAWFQEELYYLQKK